MLNFRCDCPYILWVGELNWCHFILARLPVNVTYQCTVHNIFKEFCFCPRDTTWFAACDNFCSHHRERYKTRNGTEKGRHIWHSQFLITITYQTLKEMKSTNLVCGYFSAIKWNTIIGLKLIMNSVIELDCEEVMMHWECLKNDPDVKE